MGDAKRAEEPIKTFPEYRIEDLRSLLARAREALQAYVSSLPPEARGLAEDLIAVERAVLILADQVSQLRAEVEDLRRQYDDLYYLVTGEPRAPLADLNKRERVVSWERLDAVAFTRNVHPVCLLCARICKRPYATWTFQMPPREFCEDFEGKRGIRVGGEA